MSTVRIVYVFAYVTSKATSHQISNMPHVRNLFSQAHLEVMHPVAANVVGDVDTDNISVKNSENKIPYGRQLSEQTSK
jgi:hypothetical protein